MSDEPRSQITLEVLSLAKKLSASEVGCYPMLVLLLLTQAEASPGELVGLELVAAPKADTESTPQVKFVKWTTSWAKNAAVGTYSRN